MKRFISLAALALIASTANATAIPGLYRWMVPYADASMTTSEYLADRYGVDKADVAVQDVAILPDLGDKIRKAEKELAEFNEQHQGQRRGVRI